MHTEFKEINIGIYISQCVKERGIDISRICNFMKSDVETINTMYSQESMDTQTLLRWCKLLEYDLFRLYSQHLILYSPPTRAGEFHKKKQNSKLPHFRKNIYTKEIIDFVLEMLKSEQKTKEQIIKEYGIPKTTLYKWISKYNLLEGQNV
ncbi:transposase [Chryseobacterium sp. SL1]|uniref:transposase n=1 Tax=Chryseobacterium sp. SL1 TaxID=2995159 RepID=UPI002276939A|nr:transposase [Chryseobacterium sp. SL1]MCY1663500.1 transposase [Chryseobacterium sp. SL1]